MEDSVIVADDSKENEPFIPGSCSSRKTLRNESNCNGKVKFADVTSFKKPENKVLKLNICSLLFLVLGQV